MASSDRAEKATPGAADRHERLIPSSTADQAYADVEAFIARTTPYSDLRRGRVDLGPAIQEALPQYTAAAWHTFTDVPEETDWQPADLVIPDIDDDEIEASYGIFHLTLYVNSSDKDRQRLQLTISYSALDGGIPDWANVRHPPWNHVWVHEDAGDEDAAEEG